MLLLDDFDRFSVDIDILMDPKYNNHINEIVNKIKGKFTEIEEDYRKPSGIAKKHFKFYYKSLYEINSDEKSYILLDVVFENYKFLELISKEFSNNFIEFTNSRKHVTTPSINSLLGDKLTAFAPKTIGILYSQNAQKYNKNTEIIKQLYDISKLFEKMTNLEVVRKTYYEIAKIQIKNRNLDISIMDCLEDTINTCKLILTKGNEYGIINEYEQIKKGYEGFRNYCIKNLYFDELLVMASKVYILCNMIKYGNIEFKQNLILKDTFFIKIGN